MKHYNNILFIILCMNFISIVGMQDYSAWTEEEIAARLGKINNIVSINRGELSPQLELEKRLLEEMQQKRELSKLYSQIETASKTREGEREKLAAEVKAREEEQEAASQQLRPKMEALREEKKKHEAKQAEKRRKREQKALERERLEEEAERGDRETVVRQLEEKKQKLQRMLEVALQDLRSSLYALSIKLG